jgi:hypothetical protein
MMTCFRKSLGKVNVYSTKVGRNPTFDMPSDSAMASWGTRWQTTTSTRTRTKGLVSTYSVSTTRQDTVRGGSVASLHLPKQALSGQETASLGPPWCLLGLLRFFGFGFMALALYSRTGFMPGAYFTSSNETVSHGLTAQPHCGPGISKAMAAASKFPTNYTHRFQNRAPSRAQIRGRNRFHLVPW